MQANTLPLLTVAQVAQRLTVDQSTVRRLIRRGKLTGRKLDGCGCVRVREEDLAAYIDASEITAATPTPTPTPPRPRVQVEVRDHRAELAALMAR